MGFLDNSGDIILDAVLTDTGRFRLAKGDGSFRIAKFALADDEIDYSLYDLNHPSGSAYFDLEILQSPILEAFADNAASMKSKLITIPRTNLLYLPVLKLNELADGNLTATRTSGGSTGYFVVCVNKDTEDSFRQTNGIMLGERPANGGIRIRVDQGLDTTEISPNRGLDGGLAETQYIIEIDNRLGQIVDASGKVIARPSYIDDDNIASYFFSLGTDIDFVSENTVRDTSEGQTIAGPRGTIIEFKIMSSLELNSSTFYFTQLGSTSTITDKNGASLSIHKLNSNVRVTGATTGNSVDIPVQFIRKQ
jgi:hypothetical protein